MPRATECVAWLPGGPLRPWEAGWLDLPSRHAGTEVQRGHRGGNRVRNECLRYAPVYGAALPPARGWPGRVGPVFLDES
jgi:hypothetical protein